MRKESEEAARAPARRDSLPPHVQCARGHWHYSDAQVAGCDDRLASRIEHKNDVAARCEAEARGLRGKS